MIRSAIKQVDKQSRSKRNAVRMAWVAGLILILATCVIGAVWWYYVKNPSQQADTASPTLGPNDTSVVVLTAREFIDNNDPQGGVDYFDERIADTLDDDRKYDLLIAKVDYALLINDTDQAIKAGHAAIELREQHDSEAALARAYEANGQNDRALEHYRQALKLSQKQEVPQFGRYNISELYSNKIQELSS